MPPGEFIEAVLAAGEGQPRIAPQMAARVLADLDKPGVGAGDPLGALSEREREVLALVAEGLPNREIAGHISEATVKTHARHVLEKLRLRNRAEAAGFAARYLR